MKEQINQAIINLQAIANLGGCSDEPTIEEMAAVTADILSKVLQTGLMQMIDQTTKAISALPPRERTQWLSYFFESLEAELTEEVLQTRKTS